MHSRKNERLMVLAMAAALLLVGWVVVQGVAAPPADGQERSSLVCILEVEALGDSIYIGWVPSMPLANGQPACPAVDLRDPNIHANVLHSGFVPVCPGKWIVQSWEGIGQPRPVVWQDGATCGLGFDTLRIGGDTLLVQRSEALHDTKGWGH